MLERLFGVPGNFEKLVEISSFQSFRYLRDAHNFILWTLFNGFGEIHNT